jgi:hypothetical protein
MANLWGPVERDQSNGENGVGDGRTLTLNGTTYAKGLGAHASSDVRYALAVVDREQGGHESLAQHGLEFRAVFTSSQLEPAPS